MRLLLLILPATALLGCATAPAPQQGIDPVQASAPFVVPMDPATIPCSALTNPQALDVATQWTLGRARAGVLAGTRPAVPDEQSLSGNLSAYCATNPSATLSTAAAQLGV